MILRFTSLLMSWILAGTVTDLNTWYVQEQYVIESYFHRVDEQAPLHYNAGRILWVPLFPGDPINRTDCSGMLVWHMVHLWLVKWRFIKWMEWLDSDTLLTLGKPKHRADVKRGDRIYMEFPSWLRHIAVACDDRWEHIYDFYLDRWATCREQPPVSLIRYASNGEVEMLNKKWIILDETVEILNYFNELTNETNTGSTTDIDTGSVSSGENVWFFKVLLNAVFWV